MNNTTALPQSIASLLSTLGTPRAPLLIDVRRAPAFSADPGMIPCAIRRTPDDVTDWAPRLAELTAGRPLLAYCVHGHEVSQNTAAHLRAAGFDASYLEGGIEDWKIAGAPTMRKIAALTVLPSARAACSVSIAARGMKTLSCPFGSGTSGDTASSLVMQCNRLSPMSDGSVLASYGATSGAVPTRPRMPATPRLNTNECKAEIAVLATAAVAEDFGWGGRWSSPTVSYRERAFAYVKPCTRTETL